MNICIQYTFTENDAFLFWSQEYRPWLNKGYDIRPTIAVTKAHIDLPEVKEAVRVGRLKPDGKILNEDGQSFITKVGEGRGCET